MAALAIASFKLQFVVRRVRIVPERDAAGQPFVGPGIDLVGAEADDAFRLSEPMRFWLEELHSGRLRALSLDMVAAALLGTVEDVPRPRVIRIARESDPRETAEMLHRARPLLAYLGTVAHEKLAARQRGSVSSVSHAQLHLRRSPRK